jgi:long-chain acyl-CoA synthetase
MLCAGDPKGVIHTHGSVSSEVEAIREFLDHHKVGLTCDDVYFSFLPLAHIFDRYAGLDRHSPCWRQSDAMA